MWVSKSSWLVWFCHPCLCGWPPNFCWEQQSGWWNWRWPQRSIQLAKIWNVDVFLRVKLMWHYDKEGKSFSGEMSQPQYTQSILGRFGMTLCYPATTPMIELFFEGYALDGDTLPIDVNLFQQMIGSPLHLTICSRPEFLVSVLGLSRSEWCPTVLSLLSEMDIKIYKRDFGLRSHLWRSFIGTCCLHWLWLRCWHNWHKVNDWVYHQDRWFCCWMRRKETVICITINIAKRNILQRPSLVKKLSGSWTLYEWNRNIN